MSDLVNRSFQSAPASARPLAAALLAAHARATVALSEPRVPGSESPMSWN